jgi:hypothetical protein
MPQLPLLRERVPIKACSIFLADDYRGQIDKFFELYELGKELRSGRLKQEEYLKHANQR